MIKKSSETNNLLVLFYNCYLTCYVHVRNMFSNKLCQCLSFYLAYVILVLSFFALKTLLMLQTLLGSLKLATFVYFLLFTDMLTRCLSSYQVLFLRLSVDCPPSYSRPFQSLVYSVLLMNGLSVVDCVNSAN